MCGIFACISQHEFEPMAILTSLKKLEYRGYDSWGVAVGKDTYFEVEKETGKIGQSQLHFSPTKMAIGHTRWATHGGVTKENAHPHLSGDAHTAVIHNGIIENHLELWAGLVEQNNGGAVPHKKSQTDSEVFVHLVDSLKVKLGMAEAVRTAFTQLEGLSAFVVADAESEQLIVVKNGSPLVIGLGEGVNYVASDAHSLLEYTNKVIFLEDNQLAMITADSVMGMDALTGQKIELEAQTLDWKQTVADQGEFAHFSLKEIHEQPHIVRIIATEFEAQAIELAKLIKAHTKIYLVGCGTASYAALFGSYLLASVAGVEATAISGSELAHREAFMGAGSLVIFFSQSGETVDITQPLKRIKKNGATTVALVNVFGSTLDRLADHSFLLQAGQEVSVMSTKALMAMIAVMTRAVYQLADRAEHIQQKMLAVATTQTGLLSTSYYHQHLEPVVEFLRTVEHCFVIGRGCSYPIALEAALKLKEVTYLHAEGFAGGELKHGVIALIESGIPSLVFAPHDENYAAVISSATEIKARGGVVIGVAEKNHPIFDFHLPVTDTDGLSSLAQVVVAQLLAYHVSVAKGIDPDKPRNLAKSVTVG